VHNLVCACERQRGGFTTRRGEGRRKRRQRETAGLLSQQSLTALKAKKTPFNIGERSMEEL